MPAETGEEPERSAEMSSERRRDVAEAFDPYLDVSRRLRRTSERGQRARREGLEWRCEKGELEQFSVGLHTRASWGRWHPAIPSRDAAVGHRPSMGRPNGNRSRPSRWGKEEPSGIVKRVKALSLSGGFPVEILIRRSVSTE